MKRLTGKCNIMHLLMSKIGPIDHGKMIACIRQIIIEEVTIMNNCP